MKAAAAINRGVVVIGAGGHAKVVIELLRDSGQAVDYCVAGDGDQGDGHCLGVPVLCGDDHLARLRDLGYQQCFAAVGPNALRVELAERALGLGYGLANAISRDARISPSARLGSGVAVMAGAVINAAARIDNLAIINSAAVVEHDCHVGFAAHVAPRTVLAGKVRVGPLAFVGAGASVIPAVTIGQHARVGAGAAVISDVPPHALAVGVPARIVNTER